MLHDLEKRGRRIAVALKDLEYRIRNVRLAYLVASPVRKCFLS